MRDEVNSATDFLARLVEAGKYETSTVESFREKLGSVLYSHYEDHWFPEKPFKGSAYRCMRIVNRKMDPLIARAGSQCGLSESDLLRVLPSELTMWIDPAEVSYRIGEDGSIGVLFDSDTVIGTNPLDYSSSPASSTSSSPCPDNMSSSSSSSEQDYMTSCKDQARSAYYPTGGAAQDAGLSFEHGYFAQFVAS